MLSNELCTCRHALAFSQRDNASELDPSIQEFRQRHNMSSCIVWLPAKDKSGEITGVISELLRLDVRHACPAACRPFPSQLASLLCIQMTGLTHNPLQLRARVTYRSRDSPRLWQGLRLGRPSTQPPRSRHFLLQFRPQCRLQHLHS